MFLSLLILSKVKIFSRLIIRILVLSRFTGNSEDVVRNVKARKVQLADKSVRISLWTCWNAQTEGYRNYLREHCLCLLNYRDNYVLYLLRLLLLLVYNSLSLFFIHTWG